MATVYHSVSSFLVALSFILAIHLPFSLSYDRPKARETLSVPLDDDADDFTPQQVKYIISIAINVCIFVLQVHISLAGKDKMRVTWITNGDAPSIVEYGTSSSGVYTSSASGSASSYSYLLYDSGLIHDVVIGPLEYDQIYYYRCSSNPSRQFSFKTPPNQLPLKFSVIGDLGQTGWTNSTLEHISSSNYDVLLLPGDLSYADMVQPMWDSFGRLVEPLSSSRPWMVTQGNHEIEKLPMVARFKSYNARWKMPFDLSGSTSNLYYSFDIANETIHVIMLGSYTDFDASSDQYKWLVNDLSKAKKADWVVALIHAPWYNSNTAHQGEGEDMRVAMEKLLYAGHVDVVFAGHVHAYERFTRVYNEKEDKCGPIHITIGDGGNREGLASDFINPQPKISIFREASFGHGEFEIVNKTHAFWTWHRNENDDPVIADNMWLTSLSSNGACM